MSTAPVPTREELREHDAESRRVAQTCFDRPVVLEAGAGTGKTTCLVHRIVAWCVGEGWDLQLGRLLLESADSIAPPDDETIAERVLARVAAITFTEMAAAELAERVESSLQTFARGEIPRGFLRSELELDDGELRNRARSLAAAADRLLTSTIHAFCRRLLDSAPLAAGLAPQFQVDADFRQLRAACEEAVWEAVHQSYARTDGADEELEVLLSVGVEWDRVATALFDLASEGVPASAFARDPWPEQEVTATLQALRRDLCWFRQHCQVAFQIGKGALGKSREVAEELELLENELSAADSDESRWDVVREDRWKAATERVHGWAKSFNATEQRALGPSLEEAMAVAAHLDVGLQRIRSADVGMVRIAWRVIHRLAHEVELKLRRRGVETFSALLVDARELLVTNPAVRAEFRSSFDQLLVDEFQDTDPVQCELVAALALADVETTTDGPTLFLVGDPKQSIYGFRNADLAAYGSFVDRVVKEGGRFHRLSVNYRSVPAVLAEVERVCRPVMQEVPGIQPEFQPLVAHPGTDHADGFCEGRRETVEHWLSWLPEPENGPAPTKEDAYALEARAIALDIAELHRNHNVPYRDFALLLRATTRQEVYAQALREAGVPYVVERDRQYFQRREVQDLNALLRVLLDPHDLLALAAFLRSPLVGVPDAALLPLWRAGLPRELTAWRGDDAEAFERIVAVMNAAEERMSGAALDGRNSSLPGWTARLRSVLQSVGRLRAAQEELDASAFVRAIEDEFLPAEIEAARFLGQHRLANVQRLLGKLRESLQRSLHPRQVLRELRRAVEGVLDEEEGVPGDDAQDAVRLLTIHKSKGLTLTQVYLPNLRQGSANRNGDETKAGRWNGRVEARLFGWPSADWHHVEAWHEKVEHAERVRLLYVAATRAVDRLVFVGERSRSGQTVDPASAVSLQELVDHRPAPLASLQTDDGPEAPEPECLDQDGVRWRVPRVTEAELAGLAHTRTKTPALERAEAIREVRMVRAATDRARAHEQRPFLVAASSLAEHEATSEGEGPEREVARWVGVAMHSHLEQLDLGADFAEQARRDRARLARRAEVDLTPELRRRALQELDELLVQWPSSSLARTLRDLRGSVVARELDWVDEARGDAIGGSVGAIDLLVHDSASGQWRVIDYKTDRIEEPALEQRAAAYAGQGAAYVDCVRRFVGEDAVVAFELWFLRADRSIRLDLTSYTVCVRPPSSQE